MRSFFHVHGKRGSTVSPGPADLAEAVVSVNMFRVILVADSVGAQALRRRAW